MRNEKKAEQEENYYFLGFIAFSKFKFVCAQKWQVVQKRSFCMRNPEQMTAFECISYLKAFPFPDEFTRLRRQLRRLLCCIMRNQFQLLSLFYFRTFGLLTFTCCTFHLQSSTTPQHYTYTHAHNLHYRLYLTYDSVLLYLFVNSNLCIHTPSMHACTQLQSHSDAVNFSCRCKEHFTTQIKCICICVYAIF